MPPPRRKPRAYPNHGAPGPAAADPRLVKLEELGGRNRLTLLDAHAVFSSYHLIGETIVEGICQYIKEEKPIS
jgi:hypothetical protein